MLAIGDSILRILNFVILVLALALTASLAATANNSNPQVNFGVFAAAFALLTSSFYGILAYLFAAFAWPVILLAFDFLNVVFTFAAATAIAAAIHVHSCTNSDYIKHNAIAQKSVGRCRKAQGSVAFLYFAFFIFLASTIFSSISVAKGGLFGTSSRAAPRVGVPSVSQV